MWTKQGSRKMIDDDCKVIMEVHEQTTDIPLSLTNFIRILPNTIVLAVVEFAKPLNSTMDIRADEGFLRDFPNIHVARSYVNNPKESLVPNCIELVWVNRNGPNTETVDLNPAQNGGKNFFSCNAATYDSSPK